MNNSINTTNPSFGAKVNLEEIAQRLKNPDKVKAYIEQATKNYPRDRFDFYMHDDGAVSMVLTGCRKGESGLLLAKEQFNKLMRTSQANIKETFKLACDTLKEVIKADKKTDKKVSDLIKKGKLIEGSVQEDRIFEQNLKNNSDILTPGLDFHVLINRVKKQLLEKYDTDIVGFLKLAETNNEVREDAIKQLRPFIEKSLTSSGLTPKIKAKKKAIEFMYPNTIPTEGIQQLGTTNISDKTPKEIFTELLRGFPEEKSLEMLI